ncbi:MAG: RlmE family RNA methyltransferase [Deltaproteobacteria bacterium]|nr:RlmE family RNA methyltransferase [Deltaproteobacteria bacterium]
MPRPWVPDHHRLAAKAQGFASRAVFKLKAIDEKYGLFKPGQRVLDLGCSPGSWLQYIGSRVGQKGLAVGVDLNPPEIEMGHPLYFLPGDVSSIDFDLIRTLSRDFDVVVSDMAPKTTGIRQLDQQRSLELAQEAFNCARELLKPGGHFLVKIFAGPETEAFINTLRFSFDQVQRLKPAGSRPASPEMYVLGLKKRAGPGQGKRRRPPDITNLKEKS